MRGRKRARPDWRGDNAGRDCEVALVRLGDRFSEVDEMSLQASERVAGPAPAGNLCRVDPKAVRRRGRVRREATVRTTA